MTVTELAERLESTLLRADATTVDFQRLCEEAVALSLGTVCVPASRVILASHLTEGSAVKVCTVAGFPLGHDDPDSKRFQVEAAIDNGASEVDVVPNLGRLKDGDDMFVLRELRDVVEAADECPVKVIVETGLLTRDEVLRLCHLAKEAEARYVVATTGVGPRGATEEDVRSLRGALGAKFGIKAAGDIRDAATAQALISAGADRIGTLAVGAILQDCADVGASSR